MVPKPEIDSKEDVELEKAKIELEKDKADLWKHRFDTYLAIARDASLIIIIIATTWFNLVGGKLKDAAPEEVKSLADIGVAGAPEGPGADAAPMMAMADTASNTIFNPHVGLGLVTLLAIVIFVLPRVKKLFTRKK